MRSKNEKCTGIENMSYDVSKHENIIVLTSVKPQYTVLVNACTFMLHAYKYLQIHSTVWHQINYLNAIFMIANYLHTIVPKGLP